MIYLLKAYCFLSLSIAQLDIQTTFSNKDSYQKEVRVAVSKKATLSCEVSDLKTEVKWFKDGKQLSSSKTVHMESKDKSRLLVLDNVEKKDAGEYTCEIGNEKLIFQICVEGKNSMAVFWLVFLRFQWLNQTWAKYSFHKTKCSFWDYIPKSWFLLQKFKLPSPTRTLIRKK